MRISDWSSDVCSSDLLACEGQKPVLAIYSTFLQRGYDQFIHDIALQDLDVTFAPIGRESCRERVCQYVSLSVAVVPLKKKKTACITLQQHNVQSHNIQLTNAKLLLNSKAIRKY